MRRASRASSTSTAMMGNSPPSRCFANATSAAAQHKTKNQQAGVHATSTCFPRFPATTTPAFLPPAVFLLAIKNPATVLSWPPHTQRCSCNSRRRQSCHSRYSAHGQIVNRSSGTQVRSYSSTAVRTQKKQLPSQAAGARQNPIPSQPQYPKPPPDTSTSAPMQSDPKPQSQAQAARQGSAAAALAAQKTPASRPLLPEARPAQRVQQCNGWESLHCTTIIPFQLLARRNAVTYLSARW